MTFRVCPPLVVSAIVSCVFASACSSTPATARAFVDANLSSGATMGACNLADSTTLSIGSAPTPGATVVRANGGGVIEITCSVHAMSGGFAISIEADDNSTVIGQGGSLRMTGTVDASGSGSNIDVHVNASGTGTYQENDCTITPSFSLTNGATPAPPNVAAGRVWGHLNCPNAAQTVSGNQVFCVAQADFVFENCSE